MLRLVAVRRALVADGRQGNGGVLGALIYTIFPIDILPDPIYLDDVTVLGTALWFLTRLLRRQTSLTQGQALTKGQGGTDLAARRLVRPATGPGRPR